MPGRKSSLLDIFYSTIPDKADGIENVSNLLSEHDRVKLNLHTNEVRIKPQSDIERDYSQITYDNLINLLDENKNVKIQFIFQSQDPKFITETYIDEMNKAVKSLMTLTKVQKMKHQTKYWTKVLESQKSR